MLFMYFLFKNKDEDLIEDSNVLLNKDIEKIETIDNLQINDKCVNNEKKLKNIFSKIPLSLITLLPIILCILLLSSPNSSIASIPFLGILLLIIINPFTFILGTIISIFSFHRNLTNLINRKENNMSNFKIILSLTISGICLMITLKVILTIISNIIDILFT